MRNILQRIGGVLNSQRFFWAVILFFVFEATWIALSAKYPMAFDENFHFGLIKTYTHYWLPFLSNQPAGADAFGAVPRDPSYLYHYVMSFPYRLIAHFVYSQTIQVIILRFINIALFTTGIILFRRLLCRVGMPMKFMNITFALFVLLPFVPLLAGQINYDNLIFPLVAWACLITLTATEEFKVGKPSARTQLTLVIVCVFASLVKYEFMPVFAGIVLFLLVVLKHNNHTKVRALYKKLLRSWHGQSVYSQVLLVALLVISLGLFAQRDGVNLVKYHTFTPNCSKVLSVKSCSKYPPWDFNYHDHKDVEKSKADGTMKYENPVSYTGWWMYWMWYRTFFAVDGPKKFTNYPPLPLPAAMGAIVIVVGIIALCVCWRHVLKNNLYMQFFLIVSIVYLATLWIEGYLTYRYTGVFEIMNSRYLLPVLLLLAALMGKALYGLTRRLPVLRVSFAVIALVFFLEGGGFLTFIVRSDENWDWQNNTVIHVNNAARKALKPVLIEGKKTYTTPVWMFT